MAITRLEFQPAAREFSAARAGRPRARACPQNEQGVSSRRRVNCATVTASSAKAAREQDVQIGIEGVERGLDVRRRSPRLLVPPEAPAVAKVTPRKGLVTRWRALPSFVSM